MKIGIIDSGANADHPHVGAIAGGIAIVGDDWLDRLGHGTAVAGAIREKVPEAEIYAVKVFDTRLSTTIDAIIRALAWCVEQKMDVVNLSLGTENSAHEERFKQVLAGGLLVVSAANMLPGKLGGNVIGVAADAKCPRDEFRFRDGIFLTSPYPRSIPGVPPERNLKGASFAVANMTGIVARELAQSGRESIRERLIARAVCNP